MSIDGVDFRSCNRMDSVTNENTIDVSLDLSDHLGGLVLKEEQKLAVEALLSGKDVLAVLPTGFGKSIIYQSFVVAKKLAVSSSILVVVQLRSIIEDRCIRMAILIKFPRDRGSYCFFQKILARRMPKDDVNSSFPVALCHFLNYASGYCVVDVFYSGAPRRN